MKKILIKNIKLKKKFPDIIYNSITVTLFVNFVMMDGKKQKAQKIVYTTMENLKKH